MSSTNGPRMYEYGWAVRWVIRVLVEQGIREFVVLFAEGFGKEALPFLTGNPETFATDFTNSHGLFLKIGENQ